MQTQRDSPLRACAFPHPLILPSPPWSSRLLPGRTRPGGQWALHLGGIPPTTTVLWMRSPIAHQLCPLPTPHPCCPVRVAAISRRDNYTSLLTGLRISIWVSADSPSLPPLCSKDEVSKSRVLSHGSPVLSVRKFLLLLSLNCLIHFEEGFSGFIVHQLPWGS